MCEKYKVHLREVLVFLHIIPIMPASLSLSSVFSCTVTQSPRGHTMMRCHLPEWQANRIGDIQKTLCVSFPFPNLLNKGSLQCCLSIRHYENPIQRRNISSGSKLKKQRPFKTSYSGTMFLLHSQPSLETLEEQYIVDLSKAKRGCLQGLPASVNTKIFAHVQMKYSSARQCPGLPFGEAYLCSKINWESETLC